MSVPDPTDRRQPLSPRTAHTALRTGHDRFRAGIALTPAALAGPGPVAAVFACADPQPEPAVMFGGSDLFTVRTAGLGIGPAVLGSIEYAVDQLHVPLVVVLGHHACRLPGGTGHARVRAVIAELRHRSPLLDAAVRSGHCAIRGMSWHDSRQTLRPVPRTDPPPVCRSAPPVRPPGRPVGR
ncbi:carbonic anhydrase [Micromonospora echinofusca]|uniref:Carbonic anhydrase n=1 Tax=Micromonospora echinofusca TaxID=47858 RepID=A0ABS3VQW0_MICEH|nr:carbonic anhydrase [Micromonospora echinofusca]MBO4206924.1 carbonic anhydrase [Micromonospora echinofusca]